MNATCIFYDRKDYPDGAITELTIWQVPAPVPGSAHGLKYSLFYGYPGQRLVGYDNERGKGDHRHIGGREEAYAFTTVETLIADFIADVRTFRGAP
ncbi:hypothetical protein GALL_279410 [mine drainage metagenome]|uniref:Uncharacterized protein n=1 Tax=mine drainage metagenome TaxID=410659 RepID=A0A1J5RPZ6_9ZZZZ